MTKQEGEIDTEAHAMKREQQLRRECERELADLEGRGVTFSSLVTACDEHFQKMKVATGERSKTTHNNYRNGVSKWFSEYWNRPATDINPYVVIRVFEAMKTKGLCYGHRKKTKQVLKSIFDFGIQSGMLIMNRSPTFEVILKNDSEKKPEILTNQEIQTLISKAFESNHEWRRIWAAALLTGMRSGELCALEWSDVNLESNLLNVNKSYNCRRREFKSTKAGYWRQVPISQDFLLILNEQRAETGSTKYVFPRFWEWERGLQARVLRRFCYIHGLPSVKFHTLRMFRDSDATIYRRSGLGDESLRL